MESIEPSDGYRSRNPLSTAIVHNDIVYVSGIVGRNPDTGTLADSIAEQTTAAFENVEGALDAAGSSLENLLRVTVFLADLGDKEAMNDIYRDVVPEPYPARAVVGAELAGSAKIEVVATAHR